MGEFRDNLINSVFLFGEIEGAFIMAEKRMDVSFNTGALYGRVIRNYFRAFIDLNGKDALPVAIYEWLLDIESRSSKPIKADF